MKKEFSNIAGLNDLINRISEKVEVREVDVWAAGVIFEATYNSVVTETVDKDGIEVVKAAAFVDNKAIESLIETFPVAAVILYNLNDENYGFVNHETGEVERSGMMGSYDPIRAAQDMVKTYVGSEYDRKKRFPSEEEATAFLNETKDLEGAVIRYGSLREWEDSRDEHLSVDGVMSRARGRGTK